MVCVHRSVQVSNTCLRPCYPPSSLRVWAALHGRGAHRGGTTLTRAIMAEMQAGSDDAAALLGCDPPDAKSRICAQLEELLLRGGAQWRLEVTASEVTAAGAGEGVHVRGTCEAGTVLACYPGVIFSTDDLPVMHQLVLTGTT